VSDEETPALRVMYPEEETTVIVSDGELPTVRQTNILNYMAMEVQECNIAKGWYEDDPMVEKFDKWLDGQEELDRETKRRIMKRVSNFFGPRRFGEDIALLHSEVSEALEAYRSGGLEDQTEQLTPGVTVELDGVVTPVLAKPEGVGAELADILVRLLDTAKRCEVDLFAEWRRKVDYNWTRPTRHGNKLL
jgi:NTP pyrophosphatase (non-canonical NTP hydrolase)